MRKHWKFSLTVWSRLYNPCLLLVACSYWLVGLAPTSSIRIPQEIHLASLAQIFSINPQHIQSGLEEGKILSNLYEGLMRRNPVTFELEGAEALSWEISADQKVYTFHLRPHLVWADSTPITSSSYVDSWRHLLTPATGSPQVEEFFLFRNAKAYSNGTIRDFSQVGIEAIDPLTLRLSLLYPDPAFLERMAASHYVPIPMHKLQPGEAWNLSASHTNNAAFCLHKWKSADSSIHLVRNEKFRESVVPDTVIFHVIESENTQEKLFLTKKLHLTTTVPIHKIAQYKKKIGPNTDSPLRTVPAKCSAYGLVFNTQKVPDVRIRKALSLVIDRKALTSQLRKLGEEPALRYTPTMDRKDYEPQTPYVTSPGPQEIAHARRLLQEADHEPGKSKPLAISFLCNPREEHQKIADFLQQTWKKTLGIHVPLENSKSSVLLFSRVWTGDFTIARRTVQKMSAEPYLYLEEYAKEVENPGHWHYPPFLALFEKATYATTKAEHLRFTQEAESILLDQTVVVPLFFYKDHRLVSPHLKIRDQTGAIREWPMDPTQQDQAQNYVLVP